MSEEAAASEVSESTGSTESVESTEASPEISEETTQEEGVESTEVSQEAASEETEVPNLYEVVIDGETKQIPLDDLVKDYQLKQASYKRFQEAAQREKEAQERETKSQEFLQQLLKNPYEALMTHNVPLEHIRKHYEDVTWQLLQLDQMSDEEKASLQQKQDYERMQREYAEMQKKIEETKKVEEQRVFESQVAEQQQKYSEMISSAIEQHNLPKTPEAIQKVAGYLRSALESGYELPIEDAVGMYKEESSSAMNSILSQLSEDDLMQLIGDERMKNIRKKDIEQLKNPAGLPKEPVAAKTVSEPDRVNATDFFDNLRKSIYTR